MGRPKGGHNRRWTKEKRLKLIKEYLDGDIGILPFCAKHNLSDRMFRRWLKTYQTAGPDALEPNIYRRGNPYAALNRSKSMTKEERQALIIAKQKVEIERLKKGYEVKGVGANKVFVTLNGKSFK